MLTPAQEKQLQRYLGPLELKIMRTVWSLGPSTVNDVLHHLRDNEDTSLAYNTVMTTLARLAEKGHLQRQRAGRAYCYSGSGPEEFLRTQAAETTRQLIDGMGDVALAGIIDEIEMTPGSSDLLRRILDKAPEQT